MFYYSFEVLSHRSRETLDRTREERLTCRTVRVVCWRRGWYGSRKVRDSIETIEFDVKNLM